MNNFNNNSPGQETLPTDEQEYYEQYFLKIESLFGALKGKSLLLSPADYQLARQWFDKSIPLSCVLRGVREAFYRKLSEDDSEDDVMSLSWCRWAVNKQWKEYKNILPGEAEKEDDPDDETADEVVESELESLVFDLDLSRQQLHEEKNEGLANLLIEICCGVRNLLTEWKESRSEIDGLARELHKLNVELLSAVLDHTEPDLIRKMTLSVKRKIKSSGGKMTPEEKNITIKSALQRKLLIHYRIPNLAIFST